MDLRFRVRSNDVESDDWQPSEMRYRDFLGNADISHKSDLWRYFAQDFFHDGALTQIRFSDDMRNLSFRIDCPNIQVFDGNREEWHDASAGFECTFRNVVHFRLAAKRVNRHNDPLDHRESRVCFLYAELDTLTREVHQANRHWRTQERQFHSIIIKTAPCHRSFGLVFEEVLVKPSEPLAFERIIRDPGFRLPGYSAS